MIVGKSVRREFTGRSMARVSEESSSRGLLARVFGEFLKRILDNSPEREREFIGGFSTSL